MRRYLAALILGLAVTSLAEAQVPQNKVVKIPSSVLGPPAPVQKLADSPFKLAGQKLQQNLPAASSGLVPSPVPPQAVADLVRQNRPDIVITNVTATGTTVTTTVKNQGKTLAGLHRLKIQIFQNNTLVDTQFAAMPQLGPGQSFVMPRDLKPVRVDLPGTRIVVTEDDAENVAETNEKNNLFVKVIPASPARPSLPDLVILRRIIIEPGPGGVVATGVVKVEVKNVGTAAAGEFRVQSNPLFAGEDPNSVKPGTGTFTTVFGLAPGQSKTVAFFAGADPRVDRHLFTVDPLNQVKESRETNNRRLKVIPQIVPTPASPAAAPGASPLPDLVVDRVDFVGQEIRATIRNIGNGDAGNFRVKRQFKLKGEDRGFGTFVVAGLRAGQSKTLSVGLLSANPVDRLEVTVDDLNQVREAREDNNFSAGPPSPAFGR